MHGAARTRTTAKRTTPTAGANAVVWLGEGRALVLRESADAVAEAEVRLPVDHGDTPVALAEVAHRIGRVDRVLVLGPDDLRTALEREIVAIGHAPDSIREAVLEGPVDREVLLERLHRLA